ncbi:MAG: SigE family RNA polymerase sigma factor [Kibdelosporangium sp.]
MTFEEFTSSRLTPLLRFAVVLTGERGLAEDVVQEVLLRAHQQWRKIGSLDAPEYYVRRMITNEYLSWRRRWARVVPHATPQVEPGLLPDHAVAHAERDALRIELDKLPRRQRAVLVLRYYAGLSDAEIADTLDCNAGTVRGYASRALAALRVTLAPAAIKEHR